MSIDDKCRAFVRKNVKQLIQKYSSLEDYPPTLIPDSYFMAGSPGAGKTEWSKYFIKSLIAQQTSRRIVRIDPDELREELPDYDPTNAHLFQSGTILAVEKIIDSVLKNQQDFLLDGTFGHYSSSRKNIERCLTKGRRVGILYIYQEPKSAWQFTQQRAAVEGRTIPKSVFIESYFNAKENVNRVKSEFGSDVELWLVVRNGKQKIERTEFNIDKVDPYINMRYNPNTLERALL